MIQTSHPKRTNMNYYKTGAFAKIANVTERTIRYYDKIGLLKPSFVMENGYRHYTDKDFLKLQKILSLKQLGFTIEEIFPLVANEKEEYLKESLEMQIELLNKRMLHMENLKSSLVSATKSIEQNNFTWSRIIELIQLTSKNDYLVEQYKNASNLMIRIQLHDQFSENRIGWFHWIYQNINFHSLHRLLEIGCGNGKLWLDNSDVPETCEVFLSDISEGMVEAVKEKLGHQYNCLSIDCENIPFKNEFFDAVVANHVLFYVNDLSKGLSEISRVLSRHGVLYCSTYGVDHMKEITELVKEFDEHIWLSKDHLYENFGLENGEALLKPYFQQIETRIYQDCLKVDQVRPLINYIMSCHGNQSELLAKRMDEFEAFITEKMKGKGFIEITKSAGMIIAKK